MVKINIKTPINNKLKNRKIAIIDALFKNRGIKNKRERKLFLNPPHPQNLSFKNLNISEKEIDISLKRLKKALNKNEKIIIYGDYDADGITSTAILWETLYKIGFDVMPFLPHREKQGYGLKAKGVDAVLKLYPKASLILTVDNGIVAFEGVSYANKLDIDVIISDHHQADHASEKTQKIAKKSLKKYPPALAVIHSTDTSGAGVAYFWSQAINNFFQQQKTDQQLELAAIGNITDIMPIKGVTRSLVKYGLKNLSKSTRPGIQALLAQSQIEKSTVLSTYHIGFIIGPRLNATGRLGSSMDSLRLVCTKDKNKAMQLAFDLGKINDDRKDLTFKGLDLAFLQVDKKLQTQKIFTIASEEFNPGIIGLIAGKLVEKYYRPSIVVSIIGEEAKGSVRSIPDVNIIEILRIFKELFIDLGGHPMAAGFSILTKDIPALKIKLEDYANQNIDDKLLTPTISVETEIKLSDIDMNLYQEIEKFAPFGMENPRPVFLSRKVKVVNIHSIGKTKKHLKIQLQDSETQQIFSAIYFSAPEDAFKLKVKDLIDIIYQIQLNQFKGNAHLQLMVKKVI